MRRKDRLAKLLEIVGLDRVVVDREANVERRCGVGFDRQAAVERLEVVRVRPVLNLGAVKVNARPLPTSAM
jgi:hypothetical protein